MLNTDGVRRCDREVGAPGKGWRSCDKPAVCAEHAIPVAMRPIRILASNGTEVTLK